MHSGHHVTEATAGAGSALGCFACRSGSAGSASVSSFLREGVASECFLSP